MHNSSIGGQFPYHGSTNRNKSNGYQQQQTQTSPGSYSSSRKKKTYQRHPHADWDSKSEVHREHEQWKEGRRTDGVVWLLVFLIPITIAVIATFFYELLETMYSLNMWMLDSFNAQLHSGVLTEGSSLMFILIVYTLRSSAMISISLFLSYALTSGVASRGFPVLITYLNGVHQPHLSQLSQIPIKFFSTLTAVSSGAPIGFISLFAEIGAMLGASLVTSRPLRHIPGLRRLRNMQHERLLTTIGIGAGITCAFTSPIGGLAVILELLAQRFPVKFWQYVFSGCLVCAGTMQFIAAHFNAFSFRVRSDLGGQMWPRTRQRSLPIDYNIVVSCVVLGVISGGLSVAYSRYSQVIMKKAEARRPRVVIGVVVAYSVITILVTYGFGGNFCLNDTAADHPHHQLKEELRPVQWTTRRQSPLFCSGGGSSGSGSDSPPQSGGVERINVYGSLSMGYPDAAFRFLITPHSEAIDTPTHIGAIIVFFVVCFLTAGFFTGAHGVYNGDTLLPGAIIGAAAGRLLNALFVGLSVEIAGNQRASLYALLTAAGFLGGLTRLTFSLAFLMADIGGDARQTLFLMLTISIARAVARMVDPDSLDETLLKFHGVPLLDYTEDMHSKRLNRISLRTFQSEVAVISEDATLSELIDVLSSTTHSVFPVINREKHFVGVMYRTTLELLLWRYTDFVPRQWHVPIGRRSRSRRGQSYPYQQHHHFAQSHESTPSPDQQNSTLHELSQDIPPTPRRPLLFHEQQQHPHSPTPQKPPRRVASGSALNNLNLTNVSAVSQASTSTSMHPLAPDNQQPDEYTALRNLEVYLSRRRHKLPNLYQTLTAQIPEPALRRHRLNISRYYDDSPSVLRTACVLPLLYNLYTILGLRYVVVVNYAGHPVGMITRTDLVDTQMLVDGLGSNFPLHTVRSVRRLLPSPSMLSLVDYGSDYDDRSDDASSEVEMESDVTDDATSNNNDGDYGGGIGRLGGGRRRPGGGFGGGVTGIRSGFGRAKAALPSTRFADHFFSSQPMTIREMIENPPPPAVSGSSDTGGGGGDWDRSASDCDTMSQFSSVASSVAGGEDGGGFGVGGGGERWEEVVRWGSGTPGIQSRVLSTRPRSKRKRPNLLI